MKHYIILIFCLLSLTFLSSSCLTTDSSEKPDEVAEMRTTLGQQVSQLKEEINSLRGKIDEMQYKVDKMSQMQSQQSNEINATLKDWQKQNQAEIDKKLSGIDTNLQNISKKQEQDKKELENKTKLIVQEVSKENQEIRKQINLNKKTTTSAKTNISDSTATTSPDGETYTVSQGDTLVKIAQRYGIPLKALMEANNITDANSIKIGQKLTIPEKK